MADAMEVSNVTYEQLVDLEREFEEIEVEIIRQQAALSKNAYEKRQKTVAEIPNFWPLVFEQAPPDVDQYIQPSDAAVLLSSLKSFSVSRFEIEDGSKGDPRSVAFKFEFNENEYFEDTVLEKKFWYRHGKDGWAGLVSEPVPIKWKKDQDLTEGLLDMVLTVWEQDKKKDSTNGSGPINPKDLTPEQKALHDKIQKTGLGGASLFAWFGFRGAPISAEESQEALKKEKEEQKLRAEGKPVPEDDDEVPQLVEAKENGDEEDEDFEDFLAFEIFPDGDELAIALSEDLWPSAIKYFTQAQEQDALSDADFEELEGMDEDEDEEEEEDEEDADEPPAKKRRA
ncbi:nucleosome assembly protein [Xylariales sp. PMI_506]|nr:nucleosome assembly protein [Xylariales sp. PMI_506]